MPNHYQNLVLTLTQQPTEQEWLEFKHNFHSPDEIGKRVSALANGACLAGKKFGYLASRMARTTSLVPALVLRQKKPKATKT